MVIPPAALLLMAVSLLIDTDPGAFTDDNAAIAMLARSPERVRIAGVTTVSGNTWSAFGSASARKTLALLGLDVPVHTGAPKPLRHTAAMSRREGKLEFAGAFALPKPKAERTTAVDFLIESLERQPATVLAIGPLTNLALALRKRPAIASRIEKLVIMGGNVRVKGNVTPAAEFNFWFDPEAADEVLRAPIAHRVLFALDVCNKVVVTREDFDRVVAADTPVTRLYRESFGNEYPGFLKDASAKTYLWDELAAAYLIDPGLFETGERMRLRVETKFGEKYGAVVEDPGGTATEVVLGVDAGRAKELYRELLRR
ncbi:MAG: nucleoside hydrolase [Bryobacteraceae bacterium]